MYGKDKIVRSHIEVNGKNFLFVLCFLYKLRGNK
jgi:hypothetical protein